MAVRFLKKEDHYLSVMIDIAGIRPAGDRLKLLATALAIVFCFLCVIFLSIKYRIDPSKYLPSKDAVTFYLWAIGVCVAIVSLSFPLIIGRKRMNDFTSKVTEKLVRIYRLSR